jgi:hypothetical protein
MPAESPSFLSYSRKDYYFERAERLLAGVKGKRLTYQTTTI